MIRISLKALAVAGLLAVPANAQSGGPVGGGGEPEESAPVQRMFGNVSPEGRAILRQAMREQAAAGDRPKLRAARDKVAAILSAETLDARALKQAMDAERKLVDAQQARRQAGMLSALQKLSFADRKAFVEDAARGRDRLQRMVQHDGDSGPRRRGEPAP